jgi:outer membrane protein
MRKKLMKLTLFFFIVLLSNSFQAQTKKWTLQECVEYAVKNNITIKQSEIDEKIAAIDKKAAVGDFLPSLNANSSHSWNIGLNQNITTGLLENQTTQFTSAGLNSSIAIYNGLQNQNRLRRSKLTILASQYQLSKMKDDISLNVANAFLQILFNKENLKVLKEQLKTNEMQLVRSDELVKAGVLPRGDLLDIKATVASDKQRIVIAENSLLISKLSLVQLLQLDNFMNFEISDEFFDVKESEVMVGSPKEIFDKAKQDRVEIKIARTNLEIAERDVKAAKGAYQPSLGGFYSFSTRASYSDRIVGFDSDNNPIYEGPLPLLDQFDKNKGHNFGLQLSVPVFNGFTTRNTVERSKLALEKSKNAYRQQELDLEKNIYTAFADAKGALNSYEASLSALEARKESYNYAKEKYEVGLMNSFDFNQAQTLFVNAESEVIRSKYDYIFKVKVVEFYFGIPIIQKQ